MNATDPAIHRQSDELQALREMLMAEEIAELTKVTKKVAQISELAGDNAAFRASVSQVLADALADTNRRDPSALAAIVSPLVVQSMKSSTDDIVEVMYPLTGRMVTSSVKSAVKSLSEKINAQIESRLSPRVILASVTARVTGRSVSDQLIAGSNDASVVRALLFDKASGKVIATWSGETGEAAGYDNPELVSAMISALSNLAEETFETSTGGLRTLELDGKDLAIRRSGKHIVVLETAGNLSVAQEQILDSSFVDIVDSLVNAKDVDGQDPSNLATLVGSVSESRETVSEQSTGKWRIAGAAILILCCALAWPAWTMIRDGQLDRDVTRAQQLLVEHPELLHFPIDVSPRYDNGRIQVTGLIPGSTNVTQLYSDLKRATGRELTLRLVPIVVGQPRH